MLHRNAKIRFISAFCILVIAICKAQAGGVYIERTDLTFNLAAEQRTVDIAYPFENRQKYTVRLEQPTSSCGCTVVALKKTIFEPGEAGLISAKYTSPAFRFGEYSISINIKGYVLQEGVEIPFEEKLTATLIRPNVLELSKGVLFWRKGGALTEQEISVVVNKSHYGARAVKLLGLNSDFFRANMRTDKSGARYTLAASPVDVGQPADAIAILETVGGDGEKIQIPVRLIVR